MIEGVIIKPLDRIPDDRGTILKMQECIDKEFKGFGEIYFSTIYPNVVKGWHLHKEAVLNYAVVKGMIKLVLFDSRDDSDTKNEIMEIYMGSDNYCLVQIPPGVWNGFTAIGDEYAIIADLITVEHKKDNMLRMDPDNAFINYDWKVKNR